MGGEQRRGGGAGGVEGRAAVFAPRAAESWLDPASPMTLRLADGIESPPRLSELIDLWASDVTPTLAAAPVGAIPPAGASHLLDLAEEWLNIGGRWVPRTHRRADNQAEPPRAAG